MLKNILKVILGFNLVSLQKLFSSSISSFILSCKNAFTASHVSDTKKLLTIPKVSLEDVLGKEQTVILNIGKKETGALPYNQAVALISVLVKEQPKIALEIGTFLGHTTKLMAQNIPDLKIHTVDLPENFDDKKDNSILEKDDFHLIHTRKVGR